MKVGNTVKLKPAMWQGIKPESYGLSFTGEYIVSSFADTAYSSIKLKGFSGSWDAQAFQIVDKKRERDVSIHKYKIGDVLCCVRDYECWYKVGEKYKVRKLAFDSDYGLAYNVEAYGHNNTYSLEDDGVWVLEKDFELVREEKQVEYTGGSSNYYKVFVKNPTTLEAPYEAECNDIIEALDMTFAEGNAFKAIWRKAKARQGVQKKGYDNGLYDSEKVVFFGERMVVEAKEKADESNKETKLD